MPFRIEILEIDGDTLLFEASQREITLQVLAEVALDDRRCVLRRVHIQGAGRNSLGAARGMSRTLLKIA